MEISNQTGFIGKYFGHESRFSNMIFKGALVFVIAQQVYMPQKLKYYHLGVLFMYMIFLEFFKDDRRAFYEEYILVGTVLGCSIISIIESTFRLDLGIPYLLLLFISNYMAFRLIMSIYERIVHNNLEAFTTKNQEMLEKGTIFMKVLSIMIMATLIASSLYGVYVIITLL